MKSVKSLVSRCEASDVHTRDVGTALRGGGEPLLQTAVWYLHQICEFCACTALPPQWPARRKCGVRSLFRSLMSSPVHCEHELESQRTINPVASFGMFHAGKQVTSLWHDSSRSPASRRKSR